MSGQRRRHAAPWQRAPLKLVVAPVEVDVLVAPDKRDIRGETRSCRYSSTEACHRNRRPRSRTGERPPARFPRGATTGIYPRRIPRASRSAFPPQAWKLCGKPERRERNAPCSEGSWFRARDIVQEQSVDDVLLEAIQRIARLLVAHEYLRAPSCSRRSPKFTCELNGFAWTIPSQRQSAPPRIIVTSLNRSQFSSRHR